MEEREEVDVNSIACAEAADGDWDESDDGCNGCDADIFDGREEVGVSVDDEPALKEDGDPAEEAE